MEKNLKIISLICILLVVPNYLNAQVPKPYWAKNAIQAPESGKYIFVCGEGNGTTPEESARKAFANAVVKGQYELGSVTIGAQDIATIENGGLDAAMRFTKRQIKITCQTDPMIVENKHQDVNYKTYVLIQMSIYADGSARFYDLPQNWDCVDKNYYNEMNQYNERMRKAEMAKEKAELKKNDRFMQHGYDHYYSFAFGNGVSYGGGNIMGLTFTGRFGGRLGIEPHISVGVISKEYTYYYPSKYVYNYYNYNEYYKFNISMETDRKTMISYNVGANIFVYKGFYLGINYGVQKIDITDHYFDDYENRLHEYENTPFSNQYHTYYDYYEGYVSDFYYQGREAERFSYALHKGMSFLAGYKCYMGNKTDYGVCCYFDFGAEVKCYSETNPDFGFEKFDFAWNFGFGIAF